MEFQGCFIPSAPLIATLHITRSEAMQLLAFSLLGEQPKLLTGALVVVPNTRQLDAQHVPEWVIRRVVHVATGKLLLEDTIMVPAACLHDQPWHELSNNMQRELIAELCHFLIHNVSPPEQRLWKASEVVESLAMLQRYHALLPFLPELLAALQTDMAVQATQLGISNSTTEAPAPSAAPHSITGGQLTKHEAQELLDSVLRQPIHASIISHVQDLLVDASSDAGHSKLHAAAETWDLWLQHGPQVWQTFEDWKEWKHVADKVFARWHKGHECWQQTSLVQHAAEYQDQTHQTQHFRITADTCHAQNSDVSMLAAHSEQHQEYPPVIHATSRGPGYTTSHQRSEGARPPYDSSLPVLQPSHETGRPSSRPQSSISDIEQSSHHRERQHSRSSQGHSSMTDSQQHAHVHSRHRSQSMDRDRRTRLADSDGRAEPEPKRRRTSPSAESDADHGNGPVKHQSSGPNDRHNHHGYNQLPINESNDSWAAHIDSGSDRVRGLHPSSHIGTGRMQYGHARKHQRYDHNDVGYLLARYRAAATGGFPEEEFREYEGQLVPLLLDIGPLRLADLKHHLPIPGDLVKECRGPQHFITVRSHLFTRPSDRKKDIALVSNYMDVLRQYASVASIPRNILDRYVTNAVDRQDHLIRAYEVQLLPLMEWLHDQGFGGLPYSVVNKHTDLRMPYELHVICHKDLYVLKTSSRLFSHHSRPVIELAPDYVDVIKAGAALH